MPTRVFIGYGYSARDEWIEDYVFPIVKALGLQILHGKGMHGEQLQDGVKARIEQAAGVIGFCTLREGHEAEKFNTHPWVREEMAYALGQHLPIIEVRELGVNDFEGVIGNRQRISLNQNDRLACVAELVTAVSRWSGRKLRLECHSERGPDIRIIVRNPLFSAWYRTRIDGVDSEFRPAGDVDKIGGGIFMKVHSVPDEALIEVQGRVDGKVVFSSDWESPDAVQIKVIVIGG